MSSIVWRTAIERAPIFSYILFGNLLHISSHPLRRADPLSPLLIPFSILLPMDQVLYMYAVSLVSSVRFFFFFTGMQCYYRVAHILSTQFFFERWPMKTWVLFLKWHQFTGFMAPRRFRLMQKREERGKERERREKKWTMQLFYFLLAPCCQGSMTWEDLFSKVRQDIC